jgi:hypothetical protein
MVESRIAIEAALHAIMTRLDGLDTKL